MCYILHALGCDILLIFPSLLLDIALFTRIIMSGLSSFPSPMGDSASDTKTINWPSWFLDNCVKTADELAKADPVLLVRNSDSSNAHASPDDPIIESISGRYEIDAAFFEWIQDALVADNSQSSYHKAVYLCLPKSHEDPLEARGFFSAVVQSLARDIRADLVTLDIDDMANLSEYYAHALKIDIEARQEKNGILPNTIDDIATLSKHYARALKINTELFQGNNGIWPKALMEDHNSVPSNEFVDSPNISFWIPLKKLAMAPQLKYFDEKLPPRQVVLHIPGAYRFTGENIGRNFLRYLALSIKDELAEAHVTIILTDSENSKCSQASDMKPKDILDIMRFNSSDDDVFVIVPMQSSSLHEALEADAHKERSRRQINQLQKLARRLTASILNADDVEELAVLQPYSTIALEISSQLATVDGLVTNGTPSPYLVRCLAVVKDWSDPKEIYNGIQEAIKIQELMTRGPETENLAEQSHKTGPEADKREPILTAKARKEMIATANSFEKKIFDLIVDTGKSRPLGTRRTPPILKADNQSWPRELGRNVVRYRN